MRMGGREAEHAFSIEMRSKEHLRKVALTDGGLGVLIEGFLGELEDISIVEGVILEIKGSNGTLRIDLEECDVRKALSKKKKS